MLRSRLCDLCAQDIRYALRALGKSPGFVAAAVLTLALGIGTSTAVFTVVDSVLLKPLAYRDSGRLVTAWERVRFLGPDDQGPNPRHVDLWRKRATAFSGLTLLQHSTAGLSVGAEHPTLVGTVICEPNLFDVLEVTPLLGRAFVAQDGVQGRDTVAILSYGLWQTLFQGDPTIIGRTIRIGEVPREVIGILPENFRFPNRNALRTFRSRQPLSNTPEPGVFMSTALDLGQFSWNGEYGNWIALGRLAPAVTIEQADAQLAAIETQVVEEMPARQRDTRQGALTAFLQPLQETVVGSSWMNLWLLMAAVIGLLLIACMNLANMQLARALSRRSEAAVRLALGITASRLFWNALTETLIVAVVGGSVGVVLAALGLRLFQQVAPIDLPRLSEIHLNGTVLLFSAALVCLAAVLSGLLPIVRLVQTEPQLALQQGTGRGGVTRQGYKVRTWLIGLQVFGCTALLLITGLFTKSLLTLLREETGFDSRQVVIAEVRLSSTYRDDRRRSRFDEGALQNLRSIPGVHAAGLVSAMPLEGESWIEGLRRIDRPEQASLINLRWVSPGYFEAMGQRLVRGRFFEERDKELGSAVLSEGVAKALWGSADPIGGQVTTEGRRFTVIGVVADSRTTSLKATPARMAYLHYNDRPPYVTFFLVRAARSADMLVPRVREAIWGYVPDTTIARVKTLDAQMSDSVAIERFRTSLLMTFGAGALLLAMLGIYGVLSYCVVTRTREIGMRMALGATRSRICALTVGEAAAPVFGGVAMGLVASVEAARLVRTLLYGTQALDASVILGVLTLLLISVVAAAVVPACRAASVDPMQSLRCE